MVIILYPYYTSNFPCIKVAQDVEAKENLEATSDIDSLKSSWEDVNLDGKSAFADEPTVEKEIKKAGKMCINLPVKTYPVIEFECLVS